MKFDKTYFEQQRNKKAGEKEEQNNNQVKNSGQDQKEKCAQKTDVVTSNKWNKKK